MSTEAELVLHNVSMRYTSNSQATLRAIDLTMASGEFVGLVGESGSGKSTLGRIIAQLQRPSGGTIAWRGEPLQRYWQKRWWGQWQWQPKHADLRAAIQMMFQDPSTSLNPRMTVGQLLCEPMQLWRRLPAHTSRLWLGERLQEVGLDNATMDAYPHMLSGGQKQRVALARALALRPKLLIADEPISALDVSVQSQILNLLRSLQQALGLSVLFISHDLAAVRHLCQRAVVLYRGEIVEVLPTDAIPEQAKHPYTRSLLASQGILQVGQPRLAGAPLAAGSQISRDGCVYGAQCPWAAQVCQERPVLVAPAAQTAAAQQHLLACHLG